MNIYHYHPITLEYINSGFADQDPLNPADYLIPANATIHQPPIVSAHQAAVFTGVNGWSVVDDNRGPIYDTATGNPSAHAELGPLPSGFTSIPKPSVLHSWHGTDWVIDAVKVRNAKISQLSQACESQIISGVDCAALGSLHTYPSTRNDQNFLSARFAKAQALGASGEPYSFKCQDAAGVWSRVDHTAAQIIAVGLAVDAHITESLNHLDNCMADLAAAGEDLAAIEAVVW